VNIPPDRLASLVSSAATVIEQPDLTATLHRAVETAAFVTGAPYAALGVIGDHGSLIEFVHEGLDPATVAKIGDLPTGHGVLGTVIREAKTLVLDHIADHPDAVGFPEHHPMMDAFLGVPVRVGGKVFGNLYLTDKPGGFTKDDALLVEAVATIAGSAVMNARLQARLRRLAVVEERERIARDVHDSVIQNLFAVGLTLQGLALRAGPELEGTISDLVDRVDGAIDQLRRFIFGLRGEHQADLHRSLAMMVAELGNPAQVTIDVEPETTLDPDRLADLLQMVKEATANALRHAEATNISIRVEKLDRFVVATVSDNGIGFDVTRKPDQGTSGLGLPNLRARARRLSGHVTISSNPGEGTVVEIVVPG
jgi:signal transduction histidine kinase